MANSGAKAKLQFEVGIYVGDCWKFIVGSVFLFWDMGVEATKKLGWVLNPPKWMVYK